MDGGPKGPGRHEEAVGAGGKEEDRGGECERGAEGEV